MCYLPINVPFGAYEAYADISKYGDNDNEGEGGVKSTNLSTNKNSHIKYPQGKEFPLKYVYPFDL